MTDVRVIWNPDGGSAYISAKSKRGAAFVGGFVEHGRPAWCLSLGRRQAEDLIDCAQAAGLSVEESRFSYLGGAPLARGDAPKLERKLQRATIREIKP